MKVKVGNKWIDPKETPICILLEPGDKQNIANMSPETTKYAIYEGDFTTEEIFDWMDDKIELPL